MAEFTGYTQETVPNPADIIVLLDENGITKYMLRSDFWKDPLLPAGSVTAEMLQPKVVQEVVSASTITPDEGVQMLKVTALATNATIANPVGLEDIETEKQILIRIKDNGVARTLSWGSAYRGIGVTLPTATVAGKTMYIAGIVNVEDAKLDILSVGRQA